MCGRGGNGLLIVLLLLLAAATQSQTSNPYILNGGAGQINCNCYLLTQEATFQSGSIWNKNRISLNESFDYKFNIFLGCNDSEGADGIAFVLQPIGTSIGASGGGLGYDGVTPSIGVLIDTWQNGEDNDPPEDHISIHKNGVIDHDPLMDVASPVSALAGSPNIEDCMWHTLRIIWDASAQTLSAEIDGVERVKAMINLVGSVFNNNPMVYWGFTAATGAATNEQKVCTSLNPAFYFPADQKTCFPQALTFIDSSASFGTIDKWFWDFGDGTVYEDQAPPPHQYAKPGNYTVKLAILGNDGCVSDTFMRQVVAGSKPVAAIGRPDYAICRSFPVTLADSSKVEFGTINKWTWNIAGQEFTDQHPPPIVFNAVDNRISLRVETVEGCVSDEFADTITVGAMPCPEIYVPSAFTPNNDGRNDRFTFIASGFAIIGKFSVYNRYGQLVYSSSGATTGWDGRLKGMDQPPGTYTWLISGTDLNGETHFRKGTVILVR